MFGLRHHGGTLLDFLRSFGIVISLILLSSDSLITSAQYFSVRTCPRVFGMPNFDIHRYGGKWYEVEKYWFVFEATFSCVSVEYFDRNDGTFGVEIDMYENTLNRRLKNPGNTKYLSKDGSASFVLDLLVTETPVPFTIRYPYLVLDTDYTSYTIKYRNQQVGALCAQQMWILSRNRTLSQEARQKAHKFLNRIGLDTTRLTQSDQSSCPE